MNDWRDGFEIVWHGPVPDGVEEKVRKDILAELKNLEYPSDLVFHTIFLGDDFDGPSVLVFGVDTDDRFHAEYESESLLVSIGSDGADDKA